MGTQGDRIFQVTAERGFPDPWLSFGDSLCDEAALSTELTRAIGNARKESSDRNRSEVARVFEAKEANLRRCAGILDQVLADYDASGMWNVLDERAGRLTSPTSWRPGAVPRPSTRSRSSSRAWSSTGAS